MDIDAEVVAVARRHFPGLASCYDDPRVELQNMDASKWITDELQTARSFDAILVDSTDFGSSDPLHTVRFYRQLKRLLKRGGALVVNLTSLAWNLAGAVELAAAKTKLFRHVAVYQVYQPTYMSGHYGYIFCSDRIDPTVGHHAVDWAAFHTKVLCLPLPSTPGPASIRPVDLIHLRLSCSASSRRYPNTHNSAPNPTQLTQSIRQSIRLIPEADLLVHHMLVWGGPAGPRDVLLLTGRGNITL